MALTPAERKSAERARKKKAGLIRVDVTIHKTRRDELRVVEQKLRKPKKNLKNLLT